MIRRPPRSTLLPYTSSFRSRRSSASRTASTYSLQHDLVGGVLEPLLLQPAPVPRAPVLVRRRPAMARRERAPLRLEEHTTELPSRQSPACRPLPAITICPAA